MYMYMLMRTVNINETNELCNVGNDTRLYYTARASYSINSQLSCTDSSAMLSLITSLFKLYIYIYICVYVTVNMFIDI